MSVHVAILAASVTTFAATNIDDLLLLTLFFAKRVPTRTVVAGQYLGFLAIVVLSCLGLLLTLVIPHQWVRGLGVIPLLLGLRQLILLFKRRDEEKTVLGDRPGLTSIALVTLSNGGDNIGVYIPFFSIHRNDLWLILTSYAVLVALWCVVGKWLGNRKTTLDAVNRVGHLLVPFVLIGLGISILAA
jgi:cadmium resistance protein CadD (predicted permease)